MDQGRNGEKDKMMNEKQSWILGRATNKGWLLFKQKDTTSRTNKIKYRQTTSQSKT